MKIKISVTEAVSAQMALQQMGDNKLPIQASLIISGNQRVLDEVSKEFHNRRNDLVRKFGEPDDSGGHKVKPENIQVFNEAAGKFGDEEVELDIKTVSIKDLGTKFEVEPNVLVPLAWMITLEGQKPSKDKSR